MRGCGTTFKEARLTALERETLIDIERLANRLKVQAAELFAAVEYCRRNNTTEGLDEMVAFSFNANQHTPKYGGGGGLPVGPNGENAKYKVMIAAHTAENTTDNFGNVKGGYIALELKSVEGPTQGQAQIDRLNLNHTNPKVVEIANRQLSAYCHVIGKFQFNDFAELHGIPFIVEVGLQKDPNPNGYTEVKAIYDINGNEPGKAGSGPQANAGGALGGQPVNIPDAGQPAGGVQPQGQGWGQGNGVVSNNGSPSENAGFAQQGQAGAMNNQGQGGGYPIDNNVPMNNGNGQQGGGFPNGGQGQQGGGFQGGGQPDPNAGQGQGWGQPNNGGQGQGGGFQQGGAQGQQGGQPQGQQGGGWGQQGGGQGGGQPGWGQR